MLRYLADEDLSHHVVRALRLRDSQIDIVTVHEVGLVGADDARVLAWAAEQGRVTVTHDVCTMTRYAYERAAAGQAMPGLVEVPPGSEIANVVEDLVLLAHASLENEWEGVVLYLPLR
jgi:uncharacterized protein DUF5615